MLGIHRARDARRVAVLIRDGNKCRYCRSYVGDDAHIDHVIPRAAGGTREIDNLVTSCAGCNSRKGNTPVQEFHGAIEPGIVSERVQGVAQEIASCARRNARVRNMLVAAEVMQPE